MFSLKKTIFNLFTRGRYGVFEDSKEKKDILDLKKNINNNKSDVSKYIFECEKYQYELNLILNQITNRIINEATKNITIDVHFLREAEVSSDLLNKYKNINFQLNEFFINENKFKNYELELIQLWKRIGYQSASKELNIQNFQKDFISDESKLKKVFLVKSFYSQFNQIFEKYRLLELKYFNLFVLDYKKYDPTDKTIAFQISICNDEIFQLQESFSQISKLYNNTNLKEQNEYLKAIGFVEQFIDEFLEQFSKNIEKIEKYQLTVPIELHLSDKFNCVLRKYQGFGVKYFLQQKKLLIGDEMGLGKTVQALAAIDHFIQENISHILIIVPASLIPNWESEIRKKTKYECIILVGSKRKNVLNSWLESGGIGIVSYTTFGNDIDLYLSKLKTDKTFVIADEAEYVKNPDAQRSQAFQKITENIAYVMLLTGTPLQNRYEEFRQLIKYLDKEMAIQLSADPTTFREQVKIRYLRRNRADVLHELPEKIEIPEWVPLNDEEAKIHLEQLENMHFMQYRYLLTTATKSKKERLLQLIEEHEANNDKILVFSFFRNVIEDLEQMIQGQKIILHGGIEVDERAKRLEKFLSDENIPVALCQILAAGRGLNIQGANAVIIVEPQLNPAIEDQAIARVYRMGQRKNVIVHRLIYKDSVEEKYIEMNQRKRQEFKDYANESNTKNEYQEATETEILNAQFEQIEVLKKRLQ